MRSRRLNARHLAGVWGQYRLSGFGNPNYLDLLGVNPIEPDLKAPTVIEGLDDDSAILGQSRIDAPQRAINGQLHSLD
jgi:hypothetical protein